MRLNYPLTPFKMGLLNVLYWADSRDFNTIGAHPAHKRRALRELQEMGLVTRNMFDGWSITRHGKAAVDADRDHDGTSRQRLRVAENAIRASHGLEQLFDPERT